MRTKKIIRPTEGFRNGRPTLELDMRVTSKQGEDLAQVINDSVEHTQKFLQTELPSVLIVTQVQFASLNPYTEQMQHVTDRMFITNSGYVLEVKIDREIDVVPEIDEIIETSEQALNEEKDDENLLDK